MPSYAVPPFLADLLHARSPSGYENEAQTVFDHYVGPAADAYDKDALGNIQQPDTETAHVKIIVDKNRRGRTGPTWVSFRGPTQQFTEMQSNATQ